MLAAASRMGPEGLPELSTRPAGDHSPCDFCSWKALCTVNGTEPGGESCPQTRPTQPWYRVSHERTSVPNSPSVVTDIFADDFVCHGPPGVNHSRREELTGPKHCMLLDASTAVSFELEASALTATIMSKCQFVPRRRASSTSRATAQASPTGPTCLSLSGLPTERIV